MSFTDTIRALHNALAPLESGKAGAAEQFDRILRQAVVDWIQQPSTHRDALEDTLVKALDLAPASSDAPWRTRWSTLMDVLRDAARTPSLIGGLQAVEFLEAGSTAWRLLHQLSTGPARNKDLVQILSKSASHISNETKRLQDAGMVDRIPGGGRSRHIVLTPRGRELLALLPPAPSQDSTSSQSERSRSDFWVDVDEPVESFR